MKKIFYLLILLLLATSGMAIATVKIINNPGSAQSLNIWGTSNEYRRELNITGIQYSSPDANTTRITFNWRGTTNSADDANHPYMHFMLTKGKTLIKDFYFGSIASSPSGTFTHDIPNANLSNGDILYVFMTFDGRSAEVSLAEASTPLPSPAAVQIGTVQVQADQPDIEVVNVIAASSYQLNPPSITPQAGQQIWLTCHLKNIGNALVKGTNSGGNYQLIYYVNGAEVGRNTPIASIWPVEQAGQPTGYYQDNPTAQHNFGVNYTFPSGGNYTVKCVASNVLGEVNTGNNTKDVTINVTAAVAPDIEVTSISVSPNPPTVGQMATITADIRNIGNAPANNVEISFKVDGVVFFTHYPGTIAAGSSAQYNSSASGKMPFTVSGYKIVSVSVTAVPGEVNTSNNEANFNLQVKDVPTPTVDNSLLNFGSLEKGKTAQAKQVTVTNSGGGTLKSTVTVDNWIDVSPATISSNNTTLSVSLKNTSNMQAGENTGKITITDVSGKKTEIQVKVTLTEPPVLSVKNDSIDFGELVKDQKYSRTLQISNSGDGVLDVSSVSSNQTWLTVSPQNISSLTKAKSKDIQLELSTQGQDYGASMSAQLTIKSNGGDKTINVSAKIGEGAGNISTNGVTDIDFGNIVQGDISQNKEFTIFNDGKGTLSGSIKTDKEWIKVTPTSFSSNNQKFTVKLDTKNMSYGVQTGKITIQSNANNGDQYLNVKVEILEPPAKLKIDMSSLDFGEVQSDKESREKFITITNDGGHSLNGEIISNVQWLKFNPQKFSNVSKTEKIGVTVVNADNLISENEEKKAIETEIKIKNDDPLMEKKVKVIAMLIKNNMIWDIGMEFIEGTINGQMLNKNNHEIVIKLKGDEEKIDINGELKIRVKNKIKDSSIKVPVAGTVSWDRNEQKEILDDAPQNTNVVYNFKKKLTADPKTYYIGVLMGAVSTYKAVLGFDEVPDKGGPSGGPIGNGNDVWDLTEWEGAINNSYVNHTLNNMGEKISWPMCAVKIIVKGAEKHESIKKAAEVSLKKLKLNDKNINSDNPEFEVNKELTYNIKCQYDVKYIGKKSDERLVAVSKMDVNSGGEVIRTGFRAGTLNYKQDINVSNISSARFYTGVLVAPAEYEDMLKNIELTQQQWEEIIALGVVTLPLEKTSIEISGRGIRMLVISAPKMETNAGNGLQFDLVNNETNKTIEIWNSGSGKIRGNLSSSEKWINVKKGYFENLGKDKKSVDIEIIQSEVPTEIDAGKITINWSGEEAIYGSGCKGQTEIPVTLNKEYNPPEVLYPDDGEEIEEMNPEFGWANLIPGKKYEFQVESDKRKKIILSKKIDGSKEEIKYESDWPLLPGESYKWRIIEVEKEKVVLESNFRVKKWKLGW